MAPGSTCTMPTRSSGGFSVGLFVNVRLPVTVTSALRTNRRVTSTAVGVRAFVTSTDRFTTAKFTSENVNSYGPAARSSDVPPASVPRLQGDACVVRFNRDAR